MPPDPGYLKRMFRLTVEQWQAIWDFQKGKCGCCGKPLDPDGPVYTDHDHKSGEVRGLLCFRCNNSMREEVDLEFLRNAFAYQDNPPARQALGGIHYGLPGRVGTSMKRKRDLDKKRRRAEGSIQLDPPKVDDKCSVKLSSKGIKMKVLLIFLLSLVLSLPALAILPPRGPEADLFKSTFALYGHKGKDGRFLCTAWAYQKVDGGYDLLSAGHCVAESGEQSFSVAEDIGGPQTAVTVVKYEADAAFDFAIFELKTDKEYPILKLGSSVDVAVGDEIVNPNFALGAAKQLGRGFVSSGATKPGFFSVPDEFMVQAYGTGGTSGSPVLLPGTNTVIGMIVDQFTNAEGLFGGSNAGVGLGAQPIEHFAAFLAHQVTHKVADPPFAIPDSDFQKYFGPQHPFKLQDKGTTPTFTIAGYQFTINTFGMGLEPKHYYKAKVFIARWPSGGYCLTSTKKDHFSVDVQVKKV